MLPLKHREDRSALFGNNYSKKAKMDMWEDGKYQSQ